MLKLQFEELLPKSELEKRNQCLIKNSSNKQQGQPRLKVNLND